MLYGSRREDEIKSRGERFGPKLLNGEPMRNSLDMNDENLLFGGFHGRFWQCRRVIHRVPQLTEGSPSLYRSERSPAAEYGHRLDSIRLNRASERAPAEAQPRLVRCRKDMNHDSPGRSRVQSTVQRRRRMFLQGAGTRRPNRSICDWPSKTSFPFSAD